MYREIKRKTEEFRNPKIIDAYIKLDNKRGEFTKEEINKMIGH